MWQVRGERVCATTKKAWPVRRLRARLLLRVDFILRALLYLQQTFLERSHDLGHFPCHSLCMQSVQGARAGVRADDDER